MDEKSSAAGSVAQPLDGGLVLRSVFKEDIEQLAGFFMRVFAEDDGIEPDERIGFWVKDLSRLDDDPERKRFGFLVEKKASGEIVSALLAIPQVWNYAGIPILVGRPEPIATDKAFRNRGLVRALFQKFHQTSEQSGDLMQVISGIPWFYRQFGYEMAVELGGSYSGFITQVEAAEKARPEGISARTARSDDIPFLADLYRRSSSRYLMHSPLNEDWWQKELIHKHKKNLEKTGVFILEKSDGAPAGFFIISRELNDKGVFIRYVEIIPGENWQKFMPSVITESWKYGQEIARETGGDFTRYNLMLGSQHPAYQAAAEFIPMIRRPYSWYIRVEDLQKMVSRITPALEMNLKDSPFSGYDGNITISFYKSELHLKFKNGKIVAVENAPAGLWHKADLCFPDLTFLQLLFGYRSGSELLDMFTDCRIPEKFLPFVEALFPKKHSLIIPVE